MRHFDNMTMLITTCLFLVCFLFPDSKAITSSDPIDDSTQAIYCRLPRLNVHSGRLAVRNRKGVVEVLDDRIEKVPLDTRVVLLCDTERYNVVTNGSHDALCTIFGRLLPRLGQCKPANRPLNTVIRMARRQSPDIEFQPRNKTALCLIPRRYIPSLIEGYVTIRGRKPYDQYEYAEPGELARLTCASGYWAAHGSYEAACLPNGQWSGAGLGWCVNHDTLRRAKSEVIDDSEPIQRPRRDPVLQAAIDGRLEDIKKAVASGRNLETLRSDSKERGDYVIHLAAYYGYMDLIRYLVEEFPEMLELRNLDNDTALLRAVYNNQSEIVEYLVAKGADIEVKGYFGRTAVLQAFGLKNMTELLMTKYNANTTVRSNASDGQVGIVEVNRRFGYVDVTTMLRRFQRRSKSFETPKVRPNLEQLCDAVRSGDVAKVQLAFREKPRLRRRLEDQCPDSSRTPLLEAAKLGFDLIVVDLLTRGANSAAVESLSPNNNAAHFAAAFGHLNVLEVINTTDPQLLETRNSDGDTPLCRASRRNQAEIARFMVNSGVNTEKRCYQGQTAFLAAAASNSLDVLEILADYVNPYASVDVESDQQGNTALHSAAFLGHLGVAEFLLKNFAALLCRRNAKGETALSGSILKNQTAIVALLLRYGADVEAENGEGLRPLHLAAKLGNVEIAKVLLQRSPKLTPAHLNSVAGEGLYKGSNAVRIAQQFHQRAFRRFLKDFSEASSTTPETANEES